MIYYNRRLTYYGLDLYLQGYRLTISAGPLSVTVCLSYTEADTIAGIFDALRLAHNDKL